MENIIFSLLNTFLEWVVPEKIHTPPTEEISAIRRGGGEKKLFLIIVNVLGHPKGVGGLTSYFLHGGGMDVFWNDPILHFPHLLSKVFHGNFNVVQNNALIRA